MHLLFCHREIFNSSDKKNLQWESYGKSNEKSLMNKFQLKTYLFNSLYPNMGNLNFLF